MIWCSVCYFLSISVLLFLTKTKKGQNFNKNHFMVTQENRCVIHYYCYYMGFATEPKLYQFTEPRDGHCTKTLQEAHRNVGVILKVEHPPVIGSDGCHMWHEESIVYSTLLGGIELEKSNPQGLPQGKEMQIAAGCCCRAASVTSVTIQGKIKRMETKPKINGMTSVCVQVNADAELRFENRLQDSLGRTGIKEANSWMTEMWNAATTSFFSWWFCWHVSCRHPFPLLCSLPRGDVLRQEVPLLPDWCHPGLHQAEGSQGNHGQSHGPCEQAVGRSKCTESGAVPSQPSPGSTGVLGLRNSRRDGVLPILPTGMTTLCSVLDPADHTQGVCWWSTEHRILQRGQHSWAASEVGGSKYHSPPGDAVGLLNTIGFPFKLIYSS